ncbi:CRM-domain containing factor CFM3A, chloroplastic/mitochondrial [Impatiens glandulifera]|uniref:CRM-domain containing factor CFM3A, chloroplastic/mitochondrial n=1 Tax=Impatiens glandulifera TaxID=253017 RepID=UPI001FB186F6|nr:CRM-domain containing factor CFM3A, chloroplastic/mitochondrial [Impatiens glandulifera]
MAASSTSLGFLVHSSLFPSSSSHYFSIHLHRSFSVKNEKFRPIRCQQEVLLEAADFKTVSKKRRKPRPSFFEQIRDKWSLKTTPLTEKLPWSEDFQRQNEPNFEEDELEQQRHQIVEDQVSEPEEVKVIPSTKFITSTAVSAPWTHGKFKNVTGLRDFPGKIDYNDAPVQKDLAREEIASVEKRQEVSIIERTVSVTIKDDNSSHSSSIDESGSVMLPWKRWSNPTSSVDEKSSKGKADVAERFIPEAELNRLRNVSLRMVERIKIGKAGINQELVNNIHEKWKENEVVKLKFEGSSTLNMKRNHEILEKRTGGLVIWRSGSSIVLYRGMTYKFPCVQSYSKQTEDTANRPKDLIRNNAVSIRNSSRDSIHLHEGEEVTDLSEINLLLDELGPRFKDWTGPEPLPIDADLLPNVVPGYRTPYRFLREGFRRCLTGKQMTLYRQTARKMPPHFALGRNRELQGLAMAMVKLWERSAIAKIAIKRGVLNTCNERMAEELKVLTGGTLVSRNKEYIVFYRGNDFLPPVVTKAVEEAQKRNVLTEDEEEEARNRASRMFLSNSKPVKVRRLVAGTLAETKAATSEWGNQFANVDVGKMMKDAAVARHASLVRQLENRLALANRKMLKAEKAVLEVQESLEPADLPTDLETITDEERHLFRKIGLSMQPYLTVGRRDVFDGTIENIHLNWKYREVVKLFVRGKNISQVKHIAVSLEAESGGILVSLDKTVQGYSIILYRGKNYRRPLTIRPKNLLSKRQALARSIELQRREGLKHHILGLTEQIEKLKMELEDMKRTEEIDEETFRARMNVNYILDDDDDDEEESEDEEVHIGIHDWKRRQQ